jgi:pyruvate/2-oxoglutarate dehydrogenase complex dihydrolipoamide acyltransferase (E2) component
MIVAADPHRPNSRHRASPRARRLLHASGLQQHEIVGSGPDGRILAADVEAVAESDRERRGPESWPENRASEPAAAVPPAAIPSIRAAAFLAVEVDFFGVDRARRAAAESLDHLPYVARAVVDALAAFPSLNARAAERTVLVSRPVHLGVTVELGPEGPVTPVLREADSLRLASLARRLTTLVDEARAGRLDPNATDGATFTICDCGPTGMLLATPILDPTRVASLATGTVSAKPVAIEREPGEYVVTVHPVGTLGLSFDPGTIDSGYAARFLDRVRDALETRDWSAEL